MQNSLTTADRGRNASRERWTAFVKRLLECRSRCKHSQGWVVLLFWNWFILPRRIQSNFRFIRSSLFRSVLITRYWDVVQSEKNLTWPLNLLYCFNSPRIKKKYVIRIFPCQHTTKKELAKLFHPFTYVQMTMRIEVYFCIGIEILLFSALSMELLRIIWNSGELRNAADSAKHRLIQARLAIELK